MTWWKPLWTLIPGSRLDADYPENGVLIPRRNTLRAVPAAFACVSLREPTKLNQLGFGRLKREAELSQPKAQRVLNSDGVRSILETDHKVIDVAHQMGFAPQPNLDDALEPEVENVMEVHVAQ